MRPLLMAKRGFRRLAGRGEPMAVLPDLSGKTYVVTGASAGIGEQTALGLAAAGAFVHVVGRNADRTEAVAQAVGGAAHIADFASLEQVATLGRRLASIGDLDGIVHNAGLWLPSRWVSDDGFEMTLAVNHIAPFVLQRHARRGLRKGARVVVVSSRLHKDVDAFPFDDPMAEERYRSVRAYAVSKLANLLFVRELARREPDFFVNAVHPGDVATDVTRASKLLHLGSRLVAPLLLTAEEGAQTSLHVATTVATSGGYYDRLELAEPSSAAQDDIAAARLWELTESWVA